LLLDWGSPEAGELGSGLDELICGRAARALDATLALGGGRPSLLGYCMGGTMAVALARHRQGDLAGLACLAAPWDFHRGSTRQLAQVLGAILPLTLGIGAAGAAPVELLQAFFAASDAGRVADKFAAFARLPPGDPRAELFVAVEAWLADGVPLPGPVAMQCLWDWYMGNRPAHGSWRVGGGLVRPQELRLPTLVAIPERDRVVPAASAEALAAQLPDPVVLRPSSGHIGMIVGETARAQLWPDLAAWLRHIALGRGVRYKRRRTQARTRGASPCGRRDRCPPSKPGSQSSREGQ
jgi:polyhydroxyalkanoate synthase